MVTVIINNTTLTFNNVYYVNGIDGNDITGTGSKISPFKTFTKAYNTSLSGDAIYLVGKEGANYNDYTGALNKDLSIIGDGLLSKIDFGLEASSFQSSTGNIIFYRIYLIAGQVFRGAPVDTKKWFYNCIIRLNVNVIGYRDDNVNPTNVKTINCLYDSRNLTYGAYRNARYVENCIAIGNCNYANNYGIVTIKTSYQNDNFVVNGTASNQGTTFSYTINSNYSISGITWQNNGTGLNPDGTQANIGLYGGEFSWNSIKHLIKSSNKIQYFSNNEWIDTGITIPTEDDFKTYGMANLSELTIPTTQAVLLMVYNSDIGTGKLYRVNIDVEKYKSIENMIRL